MFIRKPISLFISFCLILEQSVFAQSIDLSAHFANFGRSIAQTDKFRPLHLRYLGYDNLSQDFKLLLDKGDVQKEDLENKAYLEENTQTLLKYFFIGLALPNDKFWVNLRPDSPENILDPDLEQTDIGRIFLEADLQLKKDTASFTSPQTPEGKAYWDKLYQKAGELFGTENITIPTLTRPWIVPNEIIIRESTDGAYIYKATLKVMLEDDYLKERTSEVRDTNRGGSEWVYRFSDPRLKELNQYSTQLIRENIIPKLTYEVNTSKRYAPLRQVYYSLILAQWFKARYRSQRTENREQRTEKANNYLSLIDSGNLTNLTSSQPYDKQTYFKQYQKSFKDGEYNLKGPIYTPYGQSIRSYFSGGLELNLGQVPLLGDEITTNSPISLIPAELPKGRIPNEFLAIVFSVLTSFSLNMPGDILAKEIPEVHQGTKMDIYSLIKINPETGKGRIAIQETYIKNNPNKIVEIFLNILKGNFDLDLKNLTTSGITKKEFIGGFCGLAAFYPQIREEIVSQGINELLLVFKQEVLLADIILTILGDPETPDDVRQQIITTVLTDHYCPNVFKLVIVTD